MVNPKKSRHASDKGHRSVLAAPVLPDRHSLRKRWLLLSPALVIIGGIGILPLSVIVVYSFMSPGAVGGIEWKPTLEAWINLVLDRDIFDQTLGFNYAHPIEIVEGSELEIIDNLFPVVPSAASYKTPGCAYADDDVAHVWVRMYVDQRL